MLINAKKLKKSYKFAIKTSLYISIILTLFMSVFLYVGDAVNVFLIFGFFIVCYITCFLITKYGVERFIDRRVKKIYHDLTLLESASLRKQPITTDMATVTKEIDKYAKDKKLEIETVKVREEYRKEFVGNVSHELKTPLFTVQKSSMVDWFPKENILKGSTSIRVRRQILEPLPRWCLSGLSSKLTQSLGRA